MKTYRYDKYFDYLLKKFGEPQQCRPCREEVIKAYRNKLPEQLFSYWQNPGLCSYYNGLLWMTDPYEHHRTLKSWLEGTVFEDRNDLSVIARTAFGELHVWAKGRGEVMGIDPNLNILFYYPENDKRSFTEEEENEYMRRFWGMQKIEDEDYKDGNQKPLFERALKKFGPLKSDEQYGYKFNPKLGGNELLGNMDVVKMEVYHSIARQFEAPEVIVINP
jgi:hypothetical protein